MQKSVNPFLPGIAGIHFARHADCHPIKFSAMYQSRRSAASLSRLRLYIFCGTILAFVLVRSISSCGWFASFKLFVSISLIPFSNVQELTHICYRHLSASWFLRPAISLSNQPQSHHRPTNCSAAVSLCPRHFPGLPPQTTISAYLNAQWRW